MRLLLVKANQKISQQIQQDLHAFYVVDAVSSGKDALLDVSSIAYDLIILGLHLDDMESEEFYHLLRQQGSHTPVIVLTNSKEDDRKIMLLKMGAADYISLPYQLEELKARIHNAISHTCNCMNPGKLVFEDIVLDPFTRTVTRRDQTINLRRREFDMLECFMRNPRHTLTRTMILQHIWEHNDNLWANVVDVHIKHLRDKIDRPFGTDTIQTVHGLGYKIDTAKSPATKIIK